jgi:ribonuclease HI
MSLDPYALKIFIDGSSLKNPGGRGGLAGVAQYPDSWNKPDECIFEIGFLETTNNRMELRALNEALDHVRDRYSGRGRLERVQIITDSKYVFENYRRADLWRQNDWQNPAGKPIENYDLWKEFLSIWRKQPIRVDIVWRKGKKSPILRQVDKAAKNAADKPWVKDRGFRAGKVGRSKTGRGTASTLFPAQGQEIVIRVYRSGLVGRTGHKIIFERYDERQGIFDNKFSAFALTPGIAAELHRGHSYRVRFNQEPRNPQIAEILEIDVKVR